MQKEYKALRILAIIFKVLSFIGFIGIFFITIANFISRGINPPMMQQNFVFSLFNSLFPIFFGILQTTLLYSLGEMIILFIDIKEDLAQINKNSSN